ncbi:MAG: CinA family protein [Pseudobdellovibrio sp.]
MKQNEETLHSTLAFRLQTEVIGIVSVLRDKVLTVGFAESCTGGLLSSYFTELAGVSDVFTGSVVSYDNKVKKSFLKVSEETLKTNGAVSSETAKQMANGAQAALDVSVAVSITGIAGPSGGSPSKPVGTVFIAVAGLISETQVFEHHFNGDRKAIQLQTCVEAIKHLNEFINKK